MANIERVFRKNTKYKCLAGLREEGSRYIKSVGDSEQNFGLLNPEHTSAETNQHLNPHVTQHRGPQECNRLKELE